MVFWAIFMLPHSTPETAFQKRLGKNQKTGKQQKGKKRLQ